MIARVGNVVEIEGEIAERLKHAESLLHTFPDGTSSEDMLETLTMAIVRAISVLAKTPERAVDMARSTADCLIANVEVNAKLGRLQ